jgi:hypothetical protein
MMILATGGMLMGMLMGGVLIAYTPRATAQPYQLSGAPAPEDMAELNAVDWNYWAEYSLPGNTYLTDDAFNKLAGAGSLKFVTDGGFDTYVRYPGSFTTQWDLTEFTHLTVSFLAFNTNIGFQSGSPWIRLGDDDGNYFEYQYYQDGWPCDLLNLIIQESSYLRIIL